MDISSFISEGILVWSNLGDWSNWQMGTGWLVTIFISNIGNVVFDVIGSSVPVFTAEDIDGCFGSGDGLEWSGLGLVESVAGLNSSDSNA